MLRICNNKSFASGKVRTDMWAVWYAQSCAYSFQKLLCSKYSEKVKVYPRASHEGPEAE